MNGTSRASFGRETKWALPTSICVRAKPVDRNTRFAQATNGSEINKLRAVARCGLRPCLTIFLVACLCGTALADSRTPQRRGKVIIIRGALTVFSLGMNELGEKLEQYGLDVEVVADISAGRAASKLRSEYQRNRNVGPIVFIGHSRGAELGPKQARYLQRYKIPVKLVVMVDAVHQTSVPGNVERCVNLYHNNALGFDTRSTCSCREQTDSDGEHRHQSAVFA